MKDKIIFLIFTCSLLMLGCNNKTDFMGDESVATQHANEDKSYTSSSKAPLSKTKIASNITKLIPGYTPFGYSYDLASDFDIEDELYQIRHGDISSPLLMLIMFQNTELSDIGYKLCLSSGRPEEQCFYSLGGVNLGYGLCMANHRNQEECALAKGANNLGFGYCMASKFGNLELCKKALGGNNFGFGLCMASKYTMQRQVDCEKALGSENTGYGLCLAAGRYESECRAALGQPNVGFGLCVSEMSNSPAECSKSIGSENLGYGLCMASREAPANCAKAIGAINLGYGICMAGVGKADKCDQALGSLNTGFGLCMASGRSEKDCDDMIGANNIGYGICMAALMPDGSRISEKTCDEALNADNTGFGLCMAAARPDYTNSDGSYNYEYNYYQCKKALGGDNTGFGLCMLNPNKTLDNCNNGIGRTNIGFGLCMLSGGSKSDCYQAFNNTSLGVGICMMSGRSENNCDEGLGGYNIGFGLCMTEYRNEIERCRDLRIQANDNSESDFFIAINGGAQQPISNKVVNSTTPVKVDLSLTPDYQYLHQKADVFVVAEVKDADNKSTFYQKNGSVFNPWDQSFSSLSPAFSDVELKGTMKTTIFDGALTGIKGSINLYHGYRLKNAPINEVKYNDNRQISFTVSE